MGLKLTLKTYGPAQCKIADVRFGGENHADSYTYGWVFLVPEQVADNDGSEAAMAEAESPAAAAAAEPPQSAE